MRWGVLLAVVLLAGTARAEDDTFANPARFVAHDGATLYRDICQGCHMPDGRGAAGAGRYPALAADPRLESAGFPIFMVTHGEGAMPGFGRMLDDAQIAAVVTYIRTHFGNAYRDPVEADAVHAAR
jgi:mono/diheme cytochrome c family protein